MAGEHCLHGFTNRDIRSRLTGTRWLRACADDPKKASAKVGRCFRRLHAHGLIAKIPRTRRWRVTDYGRKVMGTTHVPARAPLPECLRRRHALNFFAKQGSHSKRIYAPRRDYVRNDTERTQAALDSWALFAVDDVVDAIEGRG